MGFLDRIIKKGLQEVANSGADEALKNLGKNLGSSLGKGLGDTLSKGLGLNTDGGQSESPRQAAPCREAPAPTRAGSEDDLPDVIDGGGRFDIRKVLPGVLRDSFPQYGVLSDVDASQLGWTGRPAQALDVVLTLQGRPAAAIAFTKKGGERNWRHKNAMAACRQAGIPFINFFTHMPNQEHYVRRRLHRFLG